MNIRPIKEVLTDFVNGTPMPKLEYDSLLFAGYVKEGVNGKPDKLTAAGKRAMQ